MSNDKTLATGDARYTTGHCAHNNRPGGCQLHNLQCGWPACDRRPAKPSLATVKHGGCVQLGGAASQIDADTLWWLQDAANTLAEGGNESHATKLHELHAALSAQPSPGAAVPAGWKIVPIEPTWSMRNDGREFLIDGIEKEPERLAYFLWKTMMNAAPEVQ